MADTKKVIVNYPSGKQEIVELGKGGFVSGGTIIWDSSINGPVPEDAEAGKMVVNAGRLEKLAQPKKEHADEAAKVSDSLRENEAAAYLKSTDWLWVMEQEVGVPVPVDVASLRATAYADLAAIKAKKG